MAAICPHLATSDQVNTRTPTCRSRQKTAPESSRHVSPYIRQRFACGKSVGKGAKNVKFLFCFIHTLGHMRPPVRTQPSRGADTKVHPIKE